MPTVFITEANLAVNLPLTRKEGHVLDDTEAEILHQIWLKRIMSRLRWLMSNGTIDITTIQAKALELSRMPMEPYSADDFDEDDDDPVLAEAMEMAKTAISQRMAAESLPVPKNIDAHARALVNQMPALMETARRRVEARFRAAANAIGDIN